MGYKSFSHCRTNPMEIEIIQGPTIIQAVAGKPCKECEEEKVQKELLEEKLAEADRVTLSAESSLDTGISAGSAQAGLKNDGGDNHQKAASGAGSTKNANLSGQNFQPEAANAQPGPSENTPGNSGPSPRVQSLLKNFASSQTADKGNR